MTGTQNYTDLFPSVQLRYAISPNSNVRFAATRGIACANYSDLAPHTEFDRYYATAPTNGGDAHLVGAEFDFSRHSDFLPGLWSGIGFDVNWTKVDSKAQVPSDTSTTAATAGLVKIRAR